jgi:hypothetical protein
MFKSILASSHHFYLVLIESDEIQSLTGLMSLIPDNKQFELIPIEGQKSYIHLQVEINKVYGSERVLQANISRKDDPSYFWYDFYLGELNLNGKTGYFICYLYSKLGKYLDNCFNTKIKKNIFKSDVESVLSYLETTLKAYEVEEKNGLLVSISKYSAQITELRKSNKMNIIGSNPLGSKVFEVLSNTEGIELVPISLKLRFKAGGYYVQLGIDKLGNFRFWLYHDGQAHQLPMIPLIINFFNDINSIENSTFINTNTLLEDDTEK